MTSSARPLDASEELNANPSELALSRAIDIKEPVLPAIAEVKSTWTQTLSVVPGVKVAIVAPLAGSLANVIAASAQVLSDTAFKLTTPPEPLVTNIRSEIGRAHV